MKLKKEFSDFYVQIRIDGEQDSLIDKRKVLQNDIEDNFPKIMSEHYIDLNKSDIRMFDQGSYKYNTTIVSDVIDRDVAVMIPLDISINSDPRRIKRYLKDAIDMPARTVEIKEPCVRASYLENEEEWMHIDLPLYAVFGSNVYLARGKATGEFSWEESDPEGLNDDLCSKINGQGQLRRIICFIKKWKNEEYSNASSDHQIPPSIGLTYLACDCFSGQTGDEGDDDLLALHQTMEAIKNHFKVSYDVNGEVASADICRALTVKPYSDLFQKMRDCSTNYLITFYKKLNKAVDNLTNAANVESEHDSGKYVQKVLGSEFEVPAKKASNANTSSKREHSFG